GNRRSSLPRPFHRSFFFNYKNKAGERRRRRPAHEPRRVRPLPPRRDREVGQGGQAGRHHRRMKIYILDAYHPAGVEYAAKHYEVVRWDDPRVKNWHDDADGVMVRMTPIRAADLARAKKVKVICKQGVGF